MEEEKGKKGERAWTEQIEDAGSELVERVKELVQMEEEKEKKGERTWTEQIEVAGSELVERVKVLIQEGNVSRLIIRNADGQTLLEVPLTAGVAVGAALTVFYPLTVALGAMAALLTRVKIEVVRTTDEHR